MTRTIWIVCASLLLGCAGDAPPRNQSICEALRPAMPVKFHGGPDGKGGPGFDTPDTIARVRSINARYAAACGGS